MKPFDSFQLEAQISDILTDIATLYDAFAEPDAFPQFGADRPMDAAYAWVSTNGASDFKLSLRDPEHETSRHARLHRAALTRSFAQNLRGLLAQVAQAMPVLDGGDGLTLGGPFKVTAGAPTMGLTLNRTPLRDHKQFTALELTQDLCGIADRIGHLAPGPRRFKVGDRLEIRAHGPEDAYRVYAALCAPHLFEGPPDTATPSVAVHEVWPVPPLQAALLT